MKDMADPETAKSRVRPDPFAWTVPPEVRWGLPDVVLAISVFVLAIIGGAFAANLGIAVTEPIAFAFSLATYLLITLVVIHASWRRGQRSLRRDFLLAFRPVDILIGFGVGIAARILALLLTVVVVIVTGHVPDQGNLVLGSDAIWVFLIGIVLASLIAPFVEELLVRGLIMQSVRNAILRRSGPQQPAPRSTQFRAMAVSVVMSALIFAALHLYQSADVVLLVILGFSTFLFGIMNGIIVYATGRLGSAIVAHIVFNGSSVLLVILLRATGLDAA